MDTEDSVMIDVMYDLGRPKEGHPKIIMMIYLLEGSKEWRDKNGANLRTLKVPDIRLRQLGHNWHHG